ncbi:MAG: hypothetical protein ACFBZ8_02925 [Opitutales bacterium]
MRLVYLTLAVLMAALCGGCSMGFPLVPPMHPLMLIEKAPNPMPRPAYAAGPTTVGLPLANQISPLDAAFGPVTETAVLHRLMDGQAATKPLLDSEVPVRGSTEGVTVRLEFQTQ